MEDLKKKAKMSVLEDLISMMKDKEAEDFKGKSSKFLPKAEMTIEVESEEPEKEDQEEMFSESEPSEEPQDDEDDIERLKEMYSRLK